MEQILPPHADGSILIVDDNPNNVSFLLDILKRDYRNLRPTTSGAFALQSALADPPDLVLLDIKMPEMDGWEVCRQFKANPRISAVPIIFISGLTDSEDKVKAFGVGGVDYISKPFQAEEILARVRTHITLYKTQQQLKESLNTKSEKLKEKTLRLEEETRDRQNTVKELEENRRIYQEIYDATSEAILIYDASTLLMLEANATALKTLNKSKTEAKKLKLGDISGDRTPFGKKELFAYLQKAATDGPQIFPWEINRPDGSRGFLEATLKYSQMQDQEVIVLVTRDISTRMKLEKQLQQAQKMEAIGTLAGGIAHDFNNILTAIFGFGQLTKSRLANDSKASEYLEMMLQSAQRATDLVRQILTFSRQKEQERMPSYLQPIIKESAKLLRASIPSTIAMRIDVDENCGKILADTTQIHQIVMNLCTNAYHAMKENGGILTVALEPVSVSLEEHFEKPSLAVGNYIRLTVSDTGCGMDAALQERIFDPYFTTKELNQGTGLGLSVVHGIVKGHDGHISVDSEPGRGTTFKVMFPCREGEKSENRPEKKISAEIQGGNERLLVVDDEKDIVQMCYEALTSLGYQVTTTTSSQEALAIIEKNLHSLDLLITDQTMPKLTGIRLAAKVKMLRQNLPIILCSGHESRAEELKLDDNISAFAQKPILPDALARLVRSTLDREKRNGFS